MRELFRRPVVRWSAVAAVVVLALSAWLFAPAAAEGGALTSRVKKGDFKVVVTTTGELRARKFVQVQGPSNAQQAEIWQMKISSLVPEGTLVKQGDIVAELDRSGIAAKLAEVTLALQKAEAQLTQAQLDSALTLATAREDLKTLEFGLEEKKLARDGSQYEAPSVRRQAEIDFQKAERALAQAKANYITKQRQAEAKMREVGADVERQRNKQKVIMDVMNAFSIRAPENGMVIYVKEWNGRKKTAGTQIGPWDPTVATLPDLTQMESLTYLNEIDVRKVSVGQPVSIALDADPSKKLAGKVVSVANVGEQRPNADAKVFEVKIEIAQADTTLRPGMTTANGIETAVVKNARWLPIEAVNADSGISYVYKVDGRRVTKQEVETGAMNDNEVVIARGLEDDDEVLLVPPADERARQPITRLPGGTKKPQPATPGPDSTPTQKVPAVPGATASATTPAATPAAQPARAAATVAAKPAN
jgi:hypothetical protein